jgi:hypothetical protein
MCPGEWANLLDQPGECLGAVQPVQDPHAHVLDIEPWRKPLGFWPSVSGPECLLG